MTACRCCTQPITGEFTARELMFGTGDRFTYGVCGSCGSMQLLDPPSDMSRWYPTHYYSFNESPRFSNRLTRAVRSAQTAAIAEHRTRFLDRVCAKCMPRPVWRADLFFDVPRSHAILDVGCGAGALLADLWSSGYDDLHGIDAFLPDGAATEARRRVDLRRGQITDHVGAFDLVMFNHSLEHMQDPLASLRHAASLLRHDGKVLVRIPMADSDNADRFGPHWFALDAPRHLWVPTFEGLAALSRRAGLTVTARSDDSAGTNEAWSRMYERGQPQVEPNGSARDLSEYFSSAELAEFDQRARDANARGRGDTTRVVLQPASATEPV